ncbi:MAG: ATP-binding cassette domain-containing protein [Planktomarina sp.]
MIQDSDHKIVSMPKSSGVLGVISNDENSKVETPKVDLAILIENAHLVQSYVSSLGKQALQMDVLEAFKSVDPKSIEEGRDVSIKAMAHAIETTGLNAAIETKVPYKKAPWPALAMMQTGQYIWVQRIEKGHAVLFDKSSADNERLVPEKDFALYYSGQILKAKPTVAALKETHIDKAKSGHWFWTAFFKYKSLLGQIMLGSLVANMLAVAVALFSLQIYDRVIPHESTATLWVLAIGAFIAIALEGLLKISRSRLMDGAGRRIEMVVQDILMGRLLGMRADKRPMGASGTFAAMREFGAVREFFTASAVGSVVDIPFIILFLALVASIGGPIVWVLVMGGILMVLPGYFLQKRMVALTREAQGANAKSGRVLQEVIFELETVKSARAEDRFRRLWNELNGLTAVTAGEQRQLASNLTFWSQGVQQATYVSAVIAGTYLVFAGSLTVGSIIAIGILTSRTLSPLSQLAGTLARWSNVKTALEGLDAVETAPQDTQEDRTYLRREKLDGQYEIRELSYRYDEDTPPVVDIASLKMNPGERAAILGTNGSGKSTLLKLMAGLYTPGKGRVLMDGVDVAQLDPRDVRRAVGYLSQDVRLFAGTLRENLNLTGLETDDTRLLAAMDFAGLGPFVRGHAKGLDMEIRDGGEGLSVGQRQSMGWARLWLQDPQVVLLDEPTAAMDQTLEAALISRLGTWLEGRTALIATHRLPILSLIDRTFILQNGRLAVDGPRDAVIAHLTKKKESA